MKALALAICLAFSFQTQAGFSAKKAELRMQDDLHKFNQRFYPKGYSWGTSGYTHGGKTRTVIVLIHGLFSSGRFFSLSALDLFNRGYNVLNLTLPGHENGQTGVPLEQYQNWLEYTETMLQYARQWGDRVVVVGHSLGGALAVLLAQKNLADGLVLFQPALKVTGFSQGLSFLGHALSAFNPDDQRMRFMSGTAATAFRFWQTQPRLSQAKIKVPTLLYSSRIDPIVSESGHLEFSQLNPQLVQLVRHNQIHMTNMFRDPQESGRIRLFLEKNFPLSKSVQLGHEM